MYIKFPTIKWIIASWRKKRIPVSLISVLPSVLGLGSVSPPALP